MYQRSPVASPETPPVAAAPAAALVQPRSANHRRRVLHQRAMYTLMSLGMLCVLAPTLLVFWFIVRNGVGQLFSSTQLSAGKIIAPEKLAARIKAGNDPVSAYLRDQMPGDARPLLDAYTAGSGAPPAKLTSALVATLNAQINSPALYDPQRFAQARLSDKTKRVIEQNKTVFTPAKKDFDPFGVGGDAGGDTAPAAGSNTNPELLASVNRSLLNETFPEAISPSRWTLGFLASAPRDGGASGGILPAILGTFALMIGTILLALPLGVFAAIYLTEYAKKGPFLRAIRMAIVNLAGVPSIVHGLFGLGLFVLFLGGNLDRLFGNARPVWQNSTLLWGSATLAILVLPVVITATEEALLTVPRSFREGSMGLGATKWQTIRRVVLPAALPGVLTGAILAVGRAAGETAPILLTAAVSWTSRGGFPGPSEPVMALPYHLYYVVTQVANAPARLQYGIALTLLILVFVVNLSAIVSRARLRASRRW